MTASVEQRNPLGRFQRGNCLADRGLNPRQFAARGGEAAGLGDRDQNAQLVKA
jgi:hypothetical protein